MWVGLYAIQSILLFQAIVVLLALDGRRLSLVDLLCLAILVLFMQGPDPMVFIVGLLVALPALVFMLFVWSRFEQRRLRRLGSPHA